MCARNMHADEVDADVSLVRQLLAAQFPQWADLPIEPVPSAMKSSPITSAAVSLWYVWRCTALAERSNVRG
jgi:hypothetical protein